MNTTINMHYDILEEVSLAAQARGISRSKIIIILLKKAMSDMPNPGRLGKMVERSSTTSFVGGCSGAFLPILKKFNPYYHKVH